MGRLDGTYPPYHKIDVDSSVWPDNYWDSSRQCPECDMHWPAIGLFHESPCHGAPTILTQDVRPTMRWPDAVKALLNYRFERWYDEYNDKVDDDKLAWNDVHTNGQFDEAKAGAEVEAFIDDVNESARK